MERASLREHDEVIRGAVVCASTTVSNIRTSLGHKVGGSLETNLRVNLFDFRHGDWVLGLLVIEDHRGTEANHLLATSFGQVVATLLALLGEASEVIAGSAQEAGEEDGQTLLALLDEVARLPPLARASPPLVAVVSSSEEHNHGVVASAVASTSGGVDGKSRQGVPRHGPALGVAVRLVGVNLGDQFCCDSLVGFFECLLCFAHLDLTWV